tara:strand:+ start:476 stop:631 length:156 start_codon:yes stop_codon:yes gene_type:complete
MEKVGLAIAFLIVGGIGVTIGLYISSQIKCHIRNNILKNNIKKHDEKKKTE